MIYKYEQQNMRHELKYLISSQDDFLLTRRLNELFSHDTYANQQGIYRVTSLYFDTPYDNALKDKINGVHKREKFRLRYYGKNISFIKLEKKFKKNGLCGKRSVVLNTSQVQMLLDGYYDFLLEMNDALCIEFYTKIICQGLKPTTIVSYEREAFTFEPAHVRITLDRYVNTGLYSTDFLNIDLTQFKVTDYTVLEVKYDEYIPEIVKLAVQLQNRKVSACSKYALCRQYD